MIHHRNFLLDTQGWYHKAHGTRHQECRQRLLCRHSPITCSLYSFTARATASLSSGMETSLGHSWENSPLGATRYTAAAAGQGRGAGRGVDGAPVPAPAQAQAPACVQ